jgi:hypothetical protein
MKNLNEKIFEQALVLWCGVLTRVNFPQTYDALKAYVSNEYSSQMTQTERAKIIYSVVSHQKKKTELSMQGGEVNQDEKDKKKCFICDRVGHKMKKCWYYDGKEAQEKMKAKQEAKKKKKEGQKLAGNGDVPVPKANADADKGCVPHKGTIVQLPPNTEKAGMCLMLDAQLYCKPCNAAGVRSGQVDFIYDSDTVSGVMGAREMDILQNVAEEDVLIETVTGERSVSKLYGDTIFGKTRILNGRRGSVLASQFATKQMYQVINPDEDTFILRGWEHNPNIRGKLWYFVRDEDRYKDKLLHCTVDLEVAKSFGIKESKFYDPVGIKSEEVCGNEQKYRIIDTMHSRYQHASANKMNNMLDQNEWQGVMERDISNWFNDKGKFCSGCVEGKMKEHARKASMKPLASNVPGELTVSDIMFVETKNNIKKPLLLHVDVCTKLITGVPLLLYILL